MDDTEQDALTAATTDREDRRPITDPALAKLAEALTLAWRNKLTLDDSRWAATLRHADEAALVQQAVVAALDGDPVPSAWKSGGPARDLAQLNHAPLPLAGIRMAQGHEVLDLRDCWLPCGGVEAEIALRLAHDVTPEQAALLLPGEGQDLIDGMAVAIELVASRWQSGSDAPDLLRAADLHSHGALALGPWQNWPGEALDWSRQACSLQFESQAAVQRVGSHSLRDPSWLLAGWLRHATRDGQTVHAGTVVTTGSWVGTLPLRRRERLCVSFVGLGALTLQL
ncbi:fumarylacetoacetate hydrolase family protein [Paucibacter sp. APW11]|uniref:Fumarylacetoacetate hydrolase family protein n=1 Tax=Roseateles aquae TaxID=3077235 RepID=A0ABU3P6B7_9BURK|nr:fumarylacetoacetate hydrolase family protein [Paucibacter sp. APW11]MDT8998104.1 fumarylacetoacetate hydrolase family protein [Paucibacter sp. APW11]